MPGANVCVSNCLLCLKQRLCTKLRFLVSLVRNHLCFFFCLLKKTIEQTNKNISFFVKKSLDLFLLLYFFFCIFLGQLSYCFQLEIEDLEIGKYAFMRDMLSTRNIKCAFSSGHK